MRRTSGTRRNRALTRHGLLAAGAGLLLALAGCKGVSSAAGGATAGGSAAPVSATSGALTTLVEPDNGVSEIYQLISSARRSVNLTMYELKDTTAENDLARAASRGVNVRVILDQHLEKSANTAAFGYLKDHGVHVVWAPAGTTYHQKTLTVDGKTSLIMTLNMVSGDYAGTRDFAVLDTSGPDVTAITTTFNADFDGRSVTPPVGDDLVWSPTNSQATILAVINGARHTLRVENEEMDDSDVTSALEAAAKRGVDVEVVMTADSEWDDAFSQLKSVGVHVRTYADSSKALYIHAKAVVADAGTAGQNLFVGSENFSKASLGENRELGIHTADTSVISTISDTIGKDYDGASGSAGSGSSSGSAGGSPGSPASASTSTSAAPSSAAPSSSGLCGAPANPYGLTLCGGGAKVTSPPSGVCRYFHCISSFDDGTGYMTECQDGTYSMSGGREGACDDHGGPGRPVTTTS